VKFKVSAWLVSGQSGTVDSGLQLTKEDARKKAEASYRALRPDQCNQTPSLGKDSSVAGCNQVPYHYCQLVSSYDEELPLAVPSQVYKHRCVLMANMRWLGFASYDRRVGNRR